MKAFGSWLTGGGQGNWRWCERGGGVNLFSWPLIVLPENQPTWGGQVSVKVTQWEEEGEDPETLVLPQIPILVGVGGVLEGSPGTPN